MVNCLTGGAETESCCTSPEVQGGTFYRTYANDGGGPTGETDPATVSNFRLDKYLVTVGRFRQFVTAVLPDGGAGWTGDGGFPDGGLRWVPEPGSGKHAHLNEGSGLANEPNVTSGQTYEPGWSPGDNVNIAPTNANLACTQYSTWTSTVGSHENLPINCVNWYEAYAFCIWDGAFLPSVTEWEYAAAGGSEQREYPWGSHAPGTDSQYAIYSGYYYGDGTYIAPVGTAALGAGLWGQVDLVGESNAWIFDWAEASYADPCIDCAYLDPSPYGSYARGGGYNFDASRLLVASDCGNASRTDRGGMYDGAGFRCARSP